ncbi:MAG TPA: SRPBCC family protein, partial [Candidatus Limnocylindrales bacterium]|nr:SRPBCC family protein [Candidatus Limnocylindrales bacterium]
YGRLLLGEVLTYTWDLEARWQAESERRRLDVGDGRVLVDLQATVPADPSVVWAHLTAPALRSRWEGPLAIEETSPAGRRGVGTVSQCITDRLATIEEIVDWHPYDHIGRRVAVPALGPVVVTTDLEIVAGGTRILLRWLHQGEEIPDEPAVERLGRERALAFERLTRVIASDLPVLGPVGAG